MFPFCLGLQIYDEKIKLQNFFKKICTFLFFRSPIRSGMTVKSGMVTSVIAGLTGYLLEVRVDGLPL